MPKVNYSVDSQGRSVVEFKKDWDTFESLLGLSYLVSFPEGQLLLFDNIIDAFSRFFNYRRMCWILFIENKNPELWKITVLLNGVPCGVLTQKLALRLATELELAIDGKYSLKPPINYTDLIELLIIEGILTTDIYDVMRAKHDELKAALVEELQMQSANVL